MAITLRMVATEGCEGWGNASMIGWQTAILLSKSKCIPTDFRKERANATEMKRGVWI